MSAPNPKIYLLPNLMTAGNLACGFFAVLMIFFGMIEVNKVTEIKRIEGELSSYAMAGTEYFQISKKYYE